MEWSRGCLRAQSTRDENEEGGRIRRPAQVHASISPCFLEDFADACFSLRRLVKLQSELQDTTNFATELAAKLDRTIAEDEHSQLVSTPGSHVPSI